MSKNPEERGLLHGKGPDNLMYLSPQKRCILLAPKPQKVEDKLPISSPGISHLKIFHLLIPIFFKYILSLDLLIPLLAYFP